MSRTPTTSGADDVTDAALPASMVGRRYRTSDHYEVGREKIREYARAVRNNHPAHWSEEAAADLGYHSLLAPPTFGAVPGYLAYAEVFDTILPGYDLSRTIQTDQMIEFHRPLLAGDRIRFEMCLDSFRHAFGGDLIGLRQTILDQHDRPVLTSRTSLVGRDDEALPPWFDAVVMHGARQEARNARRAPAPRYVGHGIESVSQAQPVPASPWVRRFDEVTAGAELPPRTLTVRRGDLVNYAGVSGDPNPIHWSTETAARMGMETVVAQGMFTIGLSVDLLTSWLGDPTALRSYNVRLTNPVHVGVTGGRIEFSGRVKRMDADTRSATIAITAEHDGRKIFGRAVAEVVLA
ncbi:MaoC family dehydratase N-terminal domain-containing protein [Streptomyces gardneri]|nr:MaoC family dehydratase N-terminal domain-containing protein [Streptomyces gardneri]MBF6204210.1 MaoC family dehydratase N-terminal domain-containing protein [Streptomyces gardneri]UAK30589.1 MaoC family dehydratase N-terminal domain-containing protein [Nocardia asteroides]